MLTNPKTFSNVKATTERLYYCHYLPVLKDKT